MLETTSNSPRLAGNRIRKAAIQINPPPNHAINARHRRMSSERNSFSNTGKPVVVIEPTISTYASKKLLSCKIIQVGTAKNTGSNINKRSKEISCIIPVSFKFLLEVAKFINAKMRNPVKLLYRKTLASPKEPIRNPYAARANIKLQATAKT